MWCGRYILYQGCQNNSEFHKVVIKFYICSYIYCTAIFGSLQVHDFVYIKRERESHVAYVEDMYEDCSANNMVLARGLVKAADDNSVTTPPDDHDI